MKLRGLFLFLLLSIFALLTACSGGHVSMVYEQGRDPHGKTDEDMINRLNMAANNPKLVPAILSDLEKEPSDFSWATFWSGLRKNRHSFDALSAEDQQKLLSLSAKIAGSSKEEDALNNFAQLVVEFGQGLDNLKLLSSNLRSAINADLVLRALDLEDSTANLDSSFSFLMTELEKRHDSWTNDEARIRRKLIPWAEKMTIAAVANSKSAAADARSADTADLAENIATEEVRASFALIARFKHVLDALGLDTNFLKDMVASRLAEGLKNPQTEQEANALIALVNKSQAEFSLESRVWMQKDPIKLRADSPLLLDPAALFDSARNLCPAKDTAGALFDKANYLKFIGFLLLQDRAVDLVLDERLACADSLPDDIVQTIFDRVSREIFPLNVDRKVVPLSVMRDYARKTLALASRTLPNPATHSAVAVQMFFSSKERANAIQESMLLLTSPKSEQSEVAKDYETIFSLLHTIKDSVDQNILKNKIYVNMIVSLKQPKTIVNEEYRVRTLGHLINIFKGDLIEFVVNETEKMPHFVKALFQSKSADQTAFIKRAMMASFIKQATLDQTLEDFSQLSAISNLLVYSGSSVFDILETKNKIEENAHIETQALLEASGNIDAAWNSFLQKNAKSLIAHLIPKTATTNILKLEQLRFIIKFIQNKETISAADQSWLDQARDSSPSMPSEAFDHRNANPVFQKLISMNDLSSLRVYMNILQLQWKTWAHEHSAKTDDNAEIVDETGVDQAANSLDQNTWVGEHFAKLVLTIDKLNGIKVSEATPSVTDKSRSEAEWSDYESDLLSQTYASEDRFNILKSHGAIVVKDLDEARAKDFTEFLIKNSSKIADDLVVLIKIDEKTIKVILAHGFYRAYPMSSEYFSGLL